MISSFAVSNPPISSQFTFLTFYTFSILVCLVIYAKKLSKFNYKPLFLISSTENLNTSINLVHPNELAKVLDNSAIDSSGSLRYYSLSVKVIINLNISIFFYFSKSKSMIYASFIISYFILDFVLYSIMRI